MKTVGDDPIAALQSTHGYLMDRKDIHGEPLDGQLPGLTKREHFAALNMAAGISGMADYTLTDKAIDILAKEAVKCADALIAELNKEVQNANV